MTDRRRPKSQAVKSELRIRVEFAERANGTREAEEFLCSPECEQFRAGFANRFKAILDHGDIPGVKPKHLRDGIHEIAQGQARIYYYKDSNCWWLTNGGLKKSKKAQDRDIDRAITIMNDSRAVRKANARGG